jgi:small-conductance mechanosensitive channel
VKTTDFPSFLAAAAGPLQAWQWLGLGLCTALGVALGIGLGRLFIRAAGRVAQRTPLPWDDDVVEATAGSAQMLLGLLVGHGLTGFLNLPELPSDRLDKVVRALLIATVVWGSIRALYALGEAVASVNVKDTLDHDRLATARARRTQVLLGIRVLSVLLCVLGVALVALQFDIVRSVGVSLLASAGVASVVLGVAAQRSLGSMLAGVQLSVSQPIRIGDAVMFRGEFGVIEDIGLTFVQIRLWDERRMLVPAPRLLEEPIENWSRSRVGLVGTVLLTVHPSTPLDLLRSALSGILASEPLWDGRTDRVQLFDVNERAATVRLLVSTGQPTELGDLRANVRERMLKFLSEHETGRYLPEPRLRIQAAVGPADPPRAQG